MALNTARILTMIAILPCVATPFASAADGDKTLLKTFARAIEREPPRYPSRALEKGQEGLVIVSYVVQPDGTVADPIVVESSGILDFERAALKTVLNWTFEPLRRTFAFDNVAGSLDELELRCDWRLYRASIGENLSWNIPDSWGKCQLHVYGASNTTFDFLEFPEATETQPIVTTSSNEGDTARLGHD
jgi:TonB family protein